SSRHRPGVPHPELLSTRHPDRGPARPRRRPSAPLAESDANAMSASTLHAIAADTVFDGVTRHAHAAVLIEGAQIAGIVSSRDGPAGTSVHTLPDGIWLAPGFVDLQVNGGGDVLFNNEPTPDAIRRIAAAHRRFGTTGLLPTLITDTAQKTEAAIAATEEA